MAIHNYLSRQERFSVGMKEAFGPGYSKSNESAIFEGPSSDGES